MYKFVVHSNEIPCGKNWRVGLDRVAHIHTYIHEVRENYPILDQSYYTSSIALLCESIWVQSRATNFVSLFQLSISDQSYYV